MTATDTASTSTAARERLESVNPATGEIIGDVPITDTAAVESALDRARDAAPSWEALGYDGRRDRLIAWRREIAHNVDELAELVHTENGKPLVEATQEIFGACQHLTFAATHAKKVLADKKVGTGAMANFRATVSYHPFGVIAVIGPWNYPIFTPMGSIAFALAAGNAVVFKPSELTPVTGKAFCELAGDALGIDNVLEVVTGDGTTGAALAGSVNVDKISFTGSAATGRRVMAAAAQNLTPVVMELGGKDAMIVAADADVEKAARAAAYGAISNAGQQCVSIERAYVVDSVYDEFVDAAADEVSELRCGAGTDDHIGPMTDPRQVEKVKAQLEDAADKGAKFRVGGVDSVKEQVIEPVVVTDVTEDMLLLKEETFGPVLPVMRVSGAEEAIEKANSVAFNLGSSVWGHAGIRALADRIKAGMTSINSVQAFSVISALPFGGVGESGFGRIHGDEGLREFARTKSTAEEKFALPMETLAFTDKPDAAVNQFKKMTKLLFGGGIVDKAGSLFRR